MAAPKAAVSCVGSTLAEGGLQPHWWPSVPVDTFIQERKLSLWRATRGESCTKVTFFFYGQKLNIHLSNKNKSQTWAETENTNFNISTIAAFFLFHCLGVRWSENICSKFWVEDFQAWNAWFLNGVYQTTRPVKQRRRIRVKMTLSYDDLAGHKFSISRTVREATPRQQREVIKVSVKMEQYCPIKPI